MPEIFLDMVDIFARQAFDSAFKHRLRSDGRGPFARLNLADAGRHFGVVGIVVERMRHDRFTHDGIRFDGVEHLEGLS